MDSRLHSQFWDTFFWGCTWRSSLRPRSSSGRFRLSNEYSACQRIAETGWCLLLGFVLIFRREPGQDINSFEIRMMPFFSYFALAFAVVYLIIPIIAYSAAGRMNDTGTRPEYKRAGERPAPNNGCEFPHCVGNKSGGVESDPGLLAALPSGVDRNNLAAVKQALKSVTAARESQVINQSVTEMKGRQFIRTTQTDRLIFQCVLIFLGCVWIWSRTKSLKIDVDLQLA